MRPMNFSTPDDKAKDMEVKEYKDEVIIQTLIYKYRCVRTKKSVSNVIEIRTIK